MSNVLNKIIKDKRLEISQREIEIPVKDLEGSPMFHRTTVSLKLALQKEQSSGIIAEFKRKSPSVGRIKRNANPIVITRGYCQAGAIALSVLTDLKYFGGRMEDVIKVREMNACPILRKDFMLSEYQVLEAKSIGADAILLIAAALDKSTTKSLAKLAHSLGMQCILEVHDPFELDYLNDWIDIVGVNNRNLKKMETDVQTSIDMIEKIPHGLLKISESGIHDPETIRYLKGIGYNGFLIGEYFMKQDNPAEACGRFIEKMNA